MLCESKCSHQLPGSVTWKAILGQREVKCWSLLFCMEYRPHLTQMKLYGGIKARCWPNNSCMLLETPGNIYQLIMCQWVSLSKKLANPSPPPLPSHQLLENYMLDRCLQTFWTADFGTLYHSSPCNISQYNQIKAGSVGLLFSEFHSTLWTPERLSCADRVSCLM